MKTIEKDSFVKVDFTLKTKKGEIVDSSIQDGPLEYIHGHKRIMPHLEAELSGKNEGDKFSFDVKPEDAYGLRDEEKVFFMEKENFGENFNKIEVGMPLEMTGPNGEFTVVMAVEIKENGIVLDANHPLAGETLSFDLEVLLVRAATIEELNEIRKK